MAIGLFNVGRDVTVNIITTNGPIVLSTITSFKAKQDSTQQKLVLINGVTHHLRFFIGWTGSFSIERASDVLDNYFALLEQNYYQGIREQGASITETIQELNGSISQFRFTNVLLSFDDAGDYAGDKSVAQSMSFVASRRIQIA